ncbi:hypothetical protein KKH82_04820 [Patescibacteria group bacterium]|nr:hypothetical protein [Patescibacteria group bacterium]
MDSDAPYDQELIEAFQFAYEVGITNKCPIDDARLSDNIRRKELVKMLVYFAVKVMGVMPDENKLGCDQYADLYHASNELKYYTKLGCQLELMGMKPDGITPMENFLPDDFVTRAQFGTTLSRLIFGRKYA